MLAVLTAWAVQGEATPAAELRLRRECRPEMPVVRLGDVVEVITADTNRATGLEQLELFAAPPAGQERYLRLRELQDMLLARGEGLLEHQFSGVSQVLVLGPGTEASPQRSVSSSTRQRAERVAIEAVRQYLDAMVVGAESWDIEVTLKDSAVETLIGGAGQCRVSGGVPPYSGQQQFDLTLTGAHGSQTIAVDARVSLPPEVVVAAWSIPRGTRLTANDLTVRRDIQPNENQMVFQTIDSLVGQQTRRAVPAGKAVLADWVGPPIMIRRGDAVTVYVRAPGLRLTTAARATKDGALGELVVLESPTDRKTFVARVCGAGEAEVMAGSIAAGNRGRTGDRGPKGT